VFCVTGMNQPAGVFACSRSSLWRLLLGAVLAMLWHAVRGPVATTAYACEHRPASIGGIYPRLTCANQEGECGIGAVVPWADRLWVITYAPHQPAGSSDKL
jgi:hypothetical protein